MNSGSRSRLLRVGIALAVLHFCLTALAASAIRDEVDPEIVGSWPVHGGGMPLSVATHEGYAYVVAGGIQYVDLRDPRRPRVTGGYPERGFFQGGIVVSGQRLYSCQGQGGLVILDLTDPSSPNPVGRFRTDARTVAAEGTRVCVGATDSLQFLDVSDAAHPRILGGWLPPEPYTGMAMGNIAVSGRYAFMASPSFGVWIIDAEHPDGPKEVARISPPTQLSSPYGIAVSGGFAYVADWQMGLVVFDVTDPSRPVERGRLATRAPAVNVVVSGEYALVCEREDGVEIVDIRNPQRPVTVGRYDTPGEAWGISVQGTVASVADRMAGLQVFDFTQPANPEPRGGVDTLRYAAGIALAAPFAFLATDDLGLEVIDVSNPERPFKVAGCEEARDAAAVVLGTDRRHAFVASYQEGVHVVDVSDPLHPVRITGWPVDGYVQGIVRTGSNVVVAIRDRGFQIVDVSEPIRPRVLHEGLPRGTTPDTRQVAVLGTLAYVVDYARGLLVFDIQNPTSPRETGRVPLRQISRMGFAGDFAYATAGPGLVTLDLSDPSKPTVINTTSERASVDAFDIRAVGDTLGVATYPGLQFFDIRNPRRPVRVGMAACGQASGIVHNGRQWIVSQLHGGVAIVDSAHGASMNLVNQEQRVFGYWGILGAERDWAAVPDSAGHLRMVRLEPSGATQDLGVLDPVYSVGSLLFHRSHMFHVRPGQVGALTVYDTSGPGLPRPMHTTNLIAYLADLAVEGNQLYVLAAGIGTPGRTPDPDGLLVFDVADPARPVRRGQFQMRGDPQALTVTNQLGFVAHGTNGLTVLDLRNPEQIRIAGQAPGDGFAHQIVLAKGCAFLGTTGDGVQIFDLVNPTTPGRVGSILPGQEITSFAIWADIAFVHSGSIHAYDLKDPAHPRRVGGYPALLQPRFSRQSFTTDGDLLVASFRDGLCRLRLRPFFRSWTRTDRALNLEWYPTEGTLLQASPATGTVSWDEVITRDATGQTTVPLEGPYRQLRLTRP